MALRFAYGVALGWAVLGLLNAHASAPSGSGESPELVVALLGDTGAGAGFASILKLVASEGSQVVMINGDFGYNESAFAWKKRLLESIDIEKVSVIGAIGNHDVGSKGEYVAAFQSFRTPSNGLGARCTGGVAITQGQDITIADEVCTFGNVSIFASGIGQMFNDSYFEGRLASKLGATPASQWKLVGYHFTLQSMNPGIKGTENTARFFDLIRQRGAIGAQAHTHSAMASCSISSAITSGSASPQCSPTSGTDLNVRFIGPGTSVYLDSSMGGKEVRSRLRCKDPGTSDCKHLVDLVSAEGYTRSDGVSKPNLPEAGAMFVAFNRGGDPSKAAVYFKTVDGQTIFSFLVTR